MSDHDARQPAFGPGGPNEVTPEDIQDAYKVSWDLGLKSMALYRDGSKASQPLCQRACRSSSSASSRKA